MIIELTTTQTLRQQQAAFIARLIASGKGLADMTAVDRAEAATLRIAVPDVGHAPVITRLPERMTMDEWQKAHR